MTHYVGALDGAAVAGLAARYGIPVNVLVAARLAAAYGHTWGCLYQAVLDHDRPLPAAWDAAGIRAWVEQGDEPALGWGISAPTCSGKSIVHETGTGQTRWTVWGEGEVYLEIHRPAGLVLDCVLAQPSMYGSGVAPPIQVIVHRVEQDNWPLPDLDGRAYARHYSAMAQALSALGHDCHAVLVQRDEGEGRFIGMGTLFEMEARPDPMDERVRIAALKVACSVGALTFPVTVPPGAPGGGFTEERCIRHCVDLFSALLAGTASSAIDFSMQRAAWTGEE